MTFTEKIVLRVRKTAEEEARNMKYLAIVANSANGGPLATALQEAVFSKTAAAELGKAASRTHPEKLASRIFINANKAWGNPVKGSMTPFHTLQGVAYRRSSSRKGTVCLQKRMELDQK